MKRWRVVVKRKAEEDIDEIWHLIADNNPRAAETFMDAIEEASTLLAATPEIGSPVTFPILSFKGCASCPCAGSKTTCCSTARLRTRK